MGFSILDGKGRGNEAAVDGRGRILSSSLVETESNYATSLGLKYNINTGDITLTNSVKTSVLYFKNNDNRDVVVDALIYNLGSSNSGSLDCVIDVIRNPTAGDIITNANDVLVGPNENANLNFGSSNTIEALAYKGATGETALSGGGVVITTRNPSPSGRIFISPGGGFILPKGTALGVDFTPSTGNVTQIVQIALNVHVKE